MIQFIQNAEIGKHMETECVHWCFPGAGEEGDE